MSTVYFVTAGLCWWSGPSSFISSGPPSPYTAALLDSPTSSSTFSASTTNANSQHFFSSNCPNAVSNIQQHFFSGNYTPSTPSLQQRTDTFVPSQEKHHNYHFSHCHQPLHHSINSMHNVCSTSSAQSTIASSLQCNTVTCSGVKTSSCADHSETMCNNCVSHVATVTASYSYSSKSCVSDLHPHRCNPHSVDGGAMKVQFSPGYLTDSATQPGRHSRQNSLTGKFRDDEIYGSGDRSRKGSLKSPLIGIYCRKSSTDEMPYFKFGYTEQERKQKMDSLNEWMRCASSLARKDQFEQNLIRTESKEKINDSSISKARYNIDSVAVAATSNIGQTDVKEDQPVVIFVERNRSMENRNKGDNENPAIDGKHVSDNEDCTESVIGEEDYEEVELDDGSESGGSHSHTEMASIIEYPADCVTPDVSLSDTQDASVEAAESAPSTGMATGTENICSVSGGKMHSPSTTKHS